jgi:phosphinothricin acetyltransferase
MLPMSGWMRTSSLPLASLIRIRLATAADAEAIAAIYRPVVESGVASFESVPPDRDEIARRVAKTTAAYPWLVCELDGVVAGYAYANEHRVRAGYRWSVNTSVYVDATRRRSGVGRGLYASLFAVLTAQGFFNAYASITLPNAASVALHQAAGFRPIGVYERVGYKLGAWHDVSWWHRVLQPHAASPDEPTMLPALVKESGWESLVRAGEPFVRSSVTP